MLEKFVAAIAPPGPAGTVALSQSEFTALCGRIPVLAPGIRHAEAKLLAEPALSRAHSSEPCRDRWTGGAVRLQGAVAVPALDPEACRWQLAYKAPTGVYELEPDSTDSNVTLLGPVDIWCLTTALPLRFRTELDGRAKEWSLLYNSAKHGLSANQFNQYVLNYPGPTVMVSPNERTSGTVGALGLGCGRKGAAGGSVASFGATVRVPPSQFRGGSFPAHSH